jgi:hypothetical protein
MRRTLSSVAALAALTLGACASSAGAPPAGASGAGPSASGRSTTDARVRSFVGQPPPELGELAWGPAPATSLAAQRGRVVFLQFAFPT